MILRSQWQGASVKVIFTTLVLLVGILLGTAGTEVADTTVSTADSAKQAMITALVKPTNVNTASADSSSSHVIYIDSRKVLEAAGFPGTLFDAEGRKPNFAVHVDRRDEPGVPEVHILGTDVIYVLKGTATFVTGGKVISPKTIEPNEIRGVATEGGDTFHLSQGDVCIVPSGVPHWFKEVQAPFFYLLVKVRQESPSGSN